MINPDMLSPDFSKESNNAASQSRNNKKGRILESIRHVELIKAENLEDALEKLQQIPLGAYVYFVSTRQKGLVEVLQNGKIVWFETPTGNGCYAAVPDEAAKETKPYDMKAIPVEKREERLKRALLDSHDIPTIPCEENELPTNASEL